MEAASLCRVRNIGYSQIAFACYSVQINTMHQKRCCCPLMKCWCLPVDKGLTFSSLQTKACDVFSLGCVFGFVLANGQHPFGDEIDRDRNIVSAKYR